MIQTYAEALKSGRKAGASHCTDTELLAGLLDSTAQILLGAVSPRLMWEGAMAKGLTSKQVMTMIRDDPQAAADLMWASP